MSVKELLEKYLHDELIQVKESGFIGRYKKTDNEIKKIENCKVKAFWSGYDYMEEESFITIALQ